MCMKLILRLPLPHHLEKKLFETHESILGNRNLCRIIFEFLGHKII